MDAKSENLRPVLEFVLSGLFVGRIFGLRMEVPIEIIGYTCVVQIVQSAPYLRNKEYEIMKRSRYKIMGPANYALKNMRNAREVSIRELAKRMEALERQGKRAVEAVLREGTGGQVKQGSATLGEI